AHRKPMDSTDAAMAWDSRCPRNLFISSSWMYICARTLTRFFAAWKSQVIRGGTKMKIALQTRAVRLLICAVALTMSVVEKPRYGQERKVINLSPARGLPFNDGI